MTGMLRKLIQRPIGRVATLALAMATTYTFCEPWNYLHALEVERGREAQIREIARRMNVDPELLLNPGGRRSFDFSRFFASIAQQLGFAESAAANEASPQSEDVKAQIAGVKSRYALVAADTTLARLAELIEVALAPENARGKKKRQIKAELQSALRLVEKDFLPPMEEGLPAVAASRDANMRGAMTRLRQDVKAVLNAPHALDEKNIDATLARLREVVGGSLRLKGNGQPRWTRDPFPLKDSYKQAPKITTQNRYGESSTGGSNATTPAVVATAVAPPPGDVRPISNAIAGDVAALGQQLGTPAKAFAFVYDNIEWESYGGVAKGARGALHERSANDWDQALLLRDLLQAQGYQAQIEWGKVELPIARAMNLVGTEDPMQAANLLATAGFDSVVLVQNGAPVAVRMTHAWVRAFIPYLPNRGTTSGTPDTWVRMDPSFKRYDYQPGVAVDVPWNESQYLQTSAVRPPHDFHADNIWAYIRANNLNCNNLAQVPKTGRIRAANYPFVPATLNTRIESLSGLAAAPPASMVQTVSLTVVDPYFGDVLVTYASSLADLWGKKLSIAFAPATSEDAAIIARYGSLYNAPAYLVRLKAVVAIDDQPVAQGGSVAPGADLSLDLSFREPHLGTDRAHHQIAAGETMTEVLDAGRTPDSLIHERIERLAALMAQPASDAQRQAVLTEQLGIVGLRYMQEVHDGFAFAAGTAWHRWVKSAFEGLVSQQLTVTYNFVGQVVRVSPADRNIDVTRLTVGILPIDSDLTERLEVMALAGVQSSYLEASIWEEVEGQQGISAVKALLLARLAGQQIRTADRTNVESVLAATNLSASVESNIRGAVAQGRIAVVPSANIRVNRWVGTGYILRDPIGGMATYPISGGFAGGSSTGGIVDRARELLGSESWLADSYLGQFIEAVFGNGEEPPSTSQSDPVNMSTGNMYRFANDLTIFARGIPVGITRAYNSRSTVNGPFGYGWTFNYGEQVIQNADGSLTYREGDGSEHRFTPSATGFTAPAGKHVELTRTAGGYEIRMKGGSRDLYDARGLLVAQTDRNGNTVTIHRDAEGFPSTVTDAAGRTMLTFTVAGGKIMAVSDLTGRTVQYAYDGDDLVAFTDALGKVWTMTYDLRHNMVSYADPLGNTQTYDYDTDDRLMRHVDAMGAEESFHYDLAGGRSVVTEKRGGDRLIRFDEHGRATMEVDPAGNRIEATYDAGNNRASLTDSRGFTTTFEHDARGNVTKRTNPDGGVSTSTYDADSRLLTSTSVGGMVSRNTYDAGGNLTRSERVVGGVTEAATSTFDSHGQVLTSTDANGNVSSFTWSGSGTIESQTDPAGGTTTYVNDPLGRVLVMKDPAGNETRKTFDARDRVVSQVDPYGLTTTFSYDDAGRQVAVTTPAGTTRFDYDAEGRPVRTTDAAGNRATTTYNAAGDVIARTDPRGNTTRYEHDLSGRVTAIIDAAGGVWKYGFCGAIATFCDVTDPAGKVLRREFDRMGRVVRITDALGNTATMEYDLEGRKVAGIDGNGQVTRYRYDEVGHLLAVLTANGGVTSFTYDANGNKTSQKDANGNVSTWRYDAKNRVVETKDPLGRATTVTYDALGNTISTTDAKGQTTRYSYQIGRPTGATYPDGTTESAVYDTLGRVTSVSNANVSYTWTYDVLGRVKSVRNERVGYLISYDYDGNGNRTKLTTPQSTATYVYDAKNRLTSIADTLFGTFRFSYDAADRRTELVYPNGIRTNYTYDKVYRLEAMVSKDAAATVVDAWSYQYDAAGNRVSRIDAQGAVETYRYDEMHQLVEANYGNGTNEKFTYDDVGNRLTRVTQDGTVVPYTYDAANQMLAAGAESFTYDANGNQTSRTSARGTTTLAYDFGNRVTGITGPDGNESNKYDALGRRMEITGGPIENVTIRPQYDLSGNPIADADGGTGIWTYRIYGPAVDEVLGEWRRSNSRITYPLHDGLGSVTAVTTTDAKVAYRQSYSAFGAMTRTQDASGTPPTRLGFTGRETSVGSLIQYRARYYDSSTGRFTSADTGPAISAVPPSLNRYIYALNSPVNFTDPSGLAVPLIWAFYFALLSWAPLLTLVFICALVGILSYLVGVWIRQLFGGPALMREEAQVIDAVFFIATFGLALLSSVSPSFRLPGLRENARHYANGSPYGWYRASSFQAGDCVKEADRFLKRFGGTPRMMSEPRNHKWVEYKGDMFDPTLRDNLAKYGGRFDDIPVGKQWFTASEHAGYLQRFSMRPGTPLDRVPPGTSVAPQDWPGPNGN